MVIAGGVFSGIVVGGDFLFPQQQLAIYPAKRDMDGNIPTS